MTVRDAHGAEAAEALGEAVLHDVLELRRRRARWRRSRDHERRAALARDLRRPRSSTSRGKRAADQRRDGVGGALADRAPSMSTPLMRVCALKGTNVGGGQIVAGSRTAAQLLCASVTMLRPSGVSSASDDSCAASRQLARASRPGAGRSATACRLPVVIVPVLSSRSTCDVARGLDGLAAHRQHVLLHHAVDAGDADGGEQAADRGRNETDQQRDQHGHREGRGRQLSACSCGCSRRTGAGRSTPAGR